MIEPEQTVKPPPAEFLSLLTDNAVHPARSLLDPYLRYESHLRQVFAEKEPQPEWSDNLINLIDVYDTSGPSFEIQPFRQEGEDETKYIMPLPERCRPAVGSSAITQSLDDFKAAFDAFTFGSLRGLDWSNVIVAGSSVLFPLLPPPGSVNPLELAAYFQQLKSATNSDIDLFLYGINADVAVRRIREIEGTIRMNQREGSEVLRTENTITFVSKYPHRHVQIVLRLYKSISEILTGFDVDCACVAFDGERVYTNPRGAVSILTRCNMIDLTRRSPSYENRLYKYRNRGFEIYWKGLERSRLNTDNCVAEADPKGLSRLIFFETRLATKCKGNSARRLLVWIMRENDCYDQFHSAYDSHVVPYGPKYDSKRTRQDINGQMIELRQKCFWGTLDEVLNGKNDTFEPLVEFKTDNPGAQGVGSFEQETGSWTQTAYSRYKVREGRRLVRVRKQRKRPGRPRKSGKPSAKEKQRPFERAFSCFLG